MKFNEINCVQWFVYLFTRFICQAPCGGGEDRIGSLVASAPRPAQNTEAPSPGDSEKTSNCVRFVSKYIKT